MFENIFPVHKTERYTECTAAYPGVPECTQAVPEAVSIRQWYEKQDDTGTPERWRLEKVIIFAVLASVAILTAYKARDALAVAVCSLILAMYSIAVDPFHLIRRKMSKASRVIMAVSMAPIIIILAHPCVRNVAVAAAILLVSSMVSLAGNQHWRKVETYKMSEHVVKALRPDDNTDHRDACLTAWQADGAREVVAAAASMGVHDCAEIEWAIRKAAYTIGFCRASTLSRRHEKERTDAINEACAAKREIEELRQRLREVEDYAMEMDAYNAKLEAANRAAANGAKAMADLMDSNEEIRKLNTQVRQLEEANEVLVNTADNPLLAAEAAEQLTLQRLREAAEKNMSVRQAEAYANVSHRRAQEFLKAYREEQERKEGKGSQRRPKAAAPAKKEADVDREQVSGDGQEDGEG